VRSDAFQCFKTKKMTNFGGLFPHCTKYNQPSSPFAFFDFALFPGDDHYTNCKTHLAAVLEQVKKLKAEIKRNGGSIIVNKVKGDPTTAVRIPLRILLGGDKAMMCEWCGVASSSKHPCVFCECCEGLFLSLDPNKPLPKARTLESLSNLQHSSVGTCDACGFEVEDEESIAQSGDPVPSQQGGASYTQTHRGARHGHQCLLVGPEDCVLCLLHLCLCIAGAMFNGLIWSKFDAIEITKVLRKVRKKEGLPKLSPKQEKVAAEERREQLYEVLAAGGIHGIRQLPGNDASKSANVEYKPLRLPGNESSLLLAGTVWEDLVDVMLPDTSALPAAEQKSWENQRKSLKKAMVAWRALYVELTGAWEEDDWVEEGRKKKAATAAELAHKFVKRWRTAAGKDTTHRYMHDCLLHIQGQIEEFGSLAMMSGQGNEHNHSKKKRVARCATNRQMGDKRETNKPVALQIMRHQAVTNSFVNLKGASSRDIMRGKRPPEQRKTRGITGVKRSRPASQGGQGPTKREPRNKKSKSS
jgi:hypothetical protein